MKKGLFIAPLFLCSMLFASTVSAGAKGPASIGTGAKTFGTTGSDYTKSIQETSDSGYIISGFTNSLSENTAYDLWVIKLNNLGDIVWQKAYGGDKNDEAYIIQETPDKGYIVAGDTYSYGAGSSDIWVLKLSLDGAIEWQKAYGGDKEDHTKAISQTSDNGYIVAGYTKSFGGGSSDIWVLKLSGDGAIEWQKTFGGKEIEETYSVKETSDNGYILAGHTASSGKGSSDALVLKLNKDGSVAWQKTYGGAGSDIAKSVYETSDKGYIVAGYTESFSDTSDAWVLKLSNDGGVIWQKTYGDKGYDYGKFIRQTSDKGYMVAGYSNSFSSGFDYWILKLNPDGSVEWQKAYGGGGSDRTYSVQETRDMGYVAAGYSESFGKGAADSWILKFDSNGDIGASCDPIRLTEATVMDTDAAPLISNLPEANTSATVTATKASPRDTLAEEETQCRAR